MFPSVQLDVRPDRAFYRPGQSVRLTVFLSTQTDRPVPARLLASTRFLARTVGELSQDLTLAAGTQTAALTWAPPADSPRGYGVDLRLETDRGLELARASSAFDVLDRWTQMPRYGFLTDFSPDRSNAAETMDSLTRYHVNALQFYDWMHRHDQFLTEDEPYLDPLGRRLSRKTVDALIDAAHARGIAAMPYTAVYGASMAFYRRHPDWALFNPDGQPTLFGDDFLAIMDPRPASPWTAHLLDQFEQVLARTGFDGIHLDTYGDPKVGHTATGERYELDAVMAGFIDATRARVDKHRPDGAVVFNAVGNWPVGTVAPAPQDIVYIELWPPHVGFEHLHQLIVEAQALGGGKPVVLAAYIPPAFTHNVLLADAVIFSSGGGHIELGEAGAMLADPYFPKCGVMSPELAERVRGYYDFAVRYQDVIGPRTRDATNHYAGRIEVDGVAASPELRKDKVWPIVREGRGVTAVSLINLLGLSAGEWGSFEEAAPTPLGPTAVSIPGMGREAAGIWWASPDGADPSPQPLGFEQTAGGRLVFEIPSLSHWGLIVIEWGQ